LTDYLIICVKNKLFGGVKIRTNFCTTPIYDMGPTPLDWEASYPDAFWWISSTAPCNQQDSTSNQATAASFNIYCN
jgi:hypothetical protein